MTAEPGAVLEIPVGLVGSDNITCLQLDLVFDLGRVGLGAARTGSAAAGHRIDSAAISTGRSRVVLYSTTLAPLSGGYIVQVPVTWATAGNSGVALNNIRLVAPNGIAVALTSTDLSPVIASNPVAGEFAAGSSLILRVAVEGIEPLAYEWKLNGNVIAGAVAPELPLNNITQTDAGTYVVRVSNPAGSATSAPATLSVTGGGASIILANLTHVYDGTPKSATAITTPVGLQVGITYDGSPTPPINAGSYAVAATINDASHTGSATGTLTIIKATAIVALGGLNQTYDGTPRLVTAVTTPAGLGVNVTYGGGSSAPVNAGVYAVVGSITNPNYQGTSPGTLTVSKAALTVRAANKTKAEGQPNPPLTVSYAGFANGETAVVLNGEPGISTTALEGSPAGTYQILVTIGTLGAQNYSFSFVPGILTILSNVFAVRIESPPSGVVHPVNQSLVFLGSFIASGAGPYSARWAFQGTTLESAIEVPGVIDETTVSLVTAFRTPGVYNVALTVIDAAETAVTTKVVGGNPDADAFVVIYDANGGFVTGGGWIWSPAGAFTLNTSLEGRANFGFTSRYRRGANIPDGNTEFQFNAGGLNFHSTAYHWLVVANNRAQFKGVGVINGEPGFGFMLTAVDGDPKRANSVDQFRIKIWDTVSDRIIYDNQLNNSDDAPLGPTTLLRGGNVTIKAP